MGHRLSIISTRTGDDGTTGLGDGSRIFKSDIQIECIGDIDELNSSLGIIVSNLNNTEFSNIFNDSQLLLNILEKFSQIQHDLFDLGGELCMPIGFELLKQQSLENLDNWIRKDNQSLVKLVEFILPGGCLVASYIHLSRCICRRAERHIVKLKQNTNIRIVILQYLNRLSDWLFIIARVVNKQLNTSDVLWKR